MKRKDLRQIPLLQPDQKLLLVLPLLQHYRLYS